MQNKRAGLTGLRPRDASGRLISRSPEEFAAYFWSRVDVAAEDDCWGWKGPRNKKGYGEIARSSVVPERRSHRVAFVLAHRRLNPGEHVLHRCDNSACCNPRHLVAGTNADNVADRVARGRQGPIRTQKLTPEQVIEIRRIGDSMTRRDIAKAFGVSGRQVLSVLRRETWKHI